MGKAMKILAIIVLLVTIAGACAVLYGMNTLMPQVEQISVLATPAVNAQNVFDDVAMQRAEGTFAGEVFAEDAAADLQDCTFLTYTIRLRNRGFFPAEWIVAKVQPHKDDVGEDVLMLPDDGAHVLSAGTTGDLSVTVLHRGDASDTARTLSISCYVFGQKIAFDAVSK